MQLSKPACDLAVCAALVGSLQNRPLEAQTLVLGEVGLAGEVRAVGQVELRLAEAAKMGFQRQEIGGLEAGERRPALALSAGLAVAARRTRSPSPRRS